ncbi:hypothetical protein LCGC14_0541110 [marine sediment metagenome]|uniref:Uncharacterized protein n=1 Tax=marine sediment metagenome TaxID=412755 RepID=A0A0F9SB55_9ZZZZ
MAGQALTPPGSSPPSTEAGKDPLAEAQQFTRQMAANALIENELAKSKAGVVKAEAEAEAAKNKAEHAKGGGGEGSGSDSPFKVSGKVDLGTFNYQDLLNKQTEEMKDLKKEANEEAAGQAAISNDLRERLHSKEMEVLTTSFAAQMQALTKMVESNASRGSFMDQYNGVMEMAKTIGLSQPQLAGDVTQSMALEKMKFEQNLELKRMGREDRQADREFTRRLNLDAEEREAKKGERAQQAKRDDMFAKAPQVIGGAIAQGLMANKGDGGGVSEQASPEPKAPKGKPGPHFEAGWGESGDGECPGCNQPIGIGPTAKTAVCANCGDSVPIIRVGEKPGASEK